MLGILVCRIKGLLHTNRSWYANRFVGNFCISYNGDKITPYFVGSILKKCRPVIARYHINSPFRSTAWHRPLPSHATEPGLLLFQPSYASTAISPEGVPHWSPLQNSFTLAVTGSASDLTRSLPLTFSAI